MVEMTLARLAVHATTREPLALLREPDTDRCLVIAIRPPQAEVMDRGPRPIDVSDDERLTQDLIADLVGLLGHRLDHGEITDLVEDRFHAVLVLNDGTRLPGRPSDVLAVAVREGLRIEVADAVLEVAGQSFSELGGDRPDPAREAAEEVQQMREFLEGATAEDFGRPPGTAGPDSGTEGEGRPPS